MRIQPSRFLGILGLSLVLSCVAQEEYPTGAPPAGSGGGGGARCDAEDVRAMVLSRCAGCHGASAPASSLDLVSSGMSSLLGVSSRGCADRPLIVAGDPGQSYLFEKLAGLPECGVQMPKGGAPLTAAELNCVSEWIEDLVAGGGSGGSGGGGGGGGSPPPPPPPGGGW